MRVRSGLVKIVAGLAVSALLLYGLAYAAWKNVTGPHCTTAEEDLIPVLTAQRIIDTYPDGAIAQPGYSGCFRDDPFPYAGKSYTFSGTREDYISFYETAAKNDGWQPIDGPYEAPCYTKKLGDATAFLLVVPVLEPGADGIEEYSIDIAAAYGDTPEDGGLLC